MINRGIPIIMAGQKVRYLLRDEFTTALAAGSVHNTPAEPGPGTRTVVDTTNLFSIVGGNLVGTGKSSTGGDPLLYESALNRVAGLLGFFNVSYSSATTNGPYFGWYFATNTYAPECGAAINTGNTLTARSGATINPTICTPTIGVSYTLAIVLRAAGSYIFIKGGAFTNYTLLYAHIIGNNASLKPAITTYSTDGFSLSYIRVPTTLWLPTPLISDGFGGTWPISDGAGHAEGIAGGLGSGGSGKTWTANLGTWGIAGGVAAASALHASGVAIATADCGTANIHANCTLARAGDNVGNVWRYIDADNYLFSYHDGTNYVLKQRLATVESTLITAAAAFGAGLGTINLTGTSARLYLNNVLIGTSAGINAAFSNATKHGLYTTNIGNTLNDFICYARGDEGQYVILNRWSN